MYINPQQVYVERDVSPTEVISCSTFRISKSDEKRRDCSDTDTASEGESVLEYSLNYLGRTDSTNASLLPIFTANTARIPNLGGNSWDNCRIYSPAESSPSLLTGCRTEESKLPTLYRKRKRLYSSGLQGTLKLPRYSDPPSISSTPPVFGGLENHSDSQQQVTIYFRFLLLPNF